MKVFSFDSNGNVDVWEVDTADQRANLAPGEFWASLPEAARLALAKAAPKYAGPWTQSGEDWVRDCADLTAGYVYPYECDGWVASEIDDREFATKDEAMAAEDEALRAKGWCLDG